MANIQRAIAFGCLMHSRRNSKTHSRACYTWSGAGGRFINRRMGAISSTLIAYLSIGGRDPLIQTSLNEPSLSHIVSDGLGESVQVALLFIPDCGLGWISGSSPPMQRGRHFKFKS